MASLPVIVEAQSSTNWFGTTYSTNFIGSYLREDFTYFNTYEQGGIVRGGILPHELPGSFPVDQVSLAMLQRFPSQVVRYVHTTNYLQGLEIRGVQPALWVGAINRDQTFYYSAYAQGSTMLFEQNAVLTSYTRTVNATTPQWATNLAGFVHVGSALVWRVRYNDNRANNQGSGWEMREQLIPLYGKQNFSIRFREAGEGLEGVPVEFRQ